MSKRRKKLRWKLVDELPGKRFKLWMNMKIGYKRCFWNDENPNEMKEEYSDE